MVAGESGGELERSVHAGVASSFPEGLNSQIYNSFDVGNLLRFVNVDTRQYRSAVPDVAGHVERAHR